MKEIIAKPDEWGSFDYQLAQKILKEKGMEVSEEQIQVLKDLRHKELAEPEKETATNIGLYYILTLILFPIGIIIGWVWAYSKKTLPNGQRVYAYNKAVQGHGKRILTIGTIMFILSIYWKVIAHLPKY